MVRCNDYFPFSLSAISLNGNNVKAYHRKSVALKSSNRYQEALKAAQDGETRARQLNQTADIRTVSSSLIYVSVSLGKF